MANIYSALTLHELVVLLHLGWTESERQTPQRVSIDIQIVFAIPPEACDSDQLSETVCYDSLYQQLTTQLCNSEFRLLEHAAKHIYDLIRAKLQSQDQLTVKLTKYPSMLPQLTAASITYGNVNPAWSSSV